MLPLLILLLLSRNTTTGLSYLLDKPLRSRSWVLTTAPSLKLRRKRGDGSDDENHDTTTAASSDQERSRQVDSLLSVHGCRLFCVLLC